MDNPYELSSPYLPHQRFLVGLIKGDIRKSSTARQSSLPSAASQQSQLQPAMARYLLEGDPVQAQQQGERTGYAAGAQGMKRFLNEWEKGWRDISGHREADKKSVITDLREKVGSILTQ